MILIGGCQGGRNDLFSNAPDTGRPPVTGPIVNPPDNNATQTVSGRVTDAAGNPLANIRVETSNGTVTRTAITGADGRYNLTQVPAGPRVVTFAGAGRATGALLTVVGSTPVTLDAVLQPTSTSATALPQITVNSPTINQQSGQATLTGSISGLESGRAVVIVNGAEAPIDVNANGTFQTIAILRPGTNTISVRAVNAQGSSVSQPLTVNYTPAAGTNFLFRATLTWDGPGDIDLHVFDPNNAHAYYGNEEIATGELDVDNTEAVGPENFSLRTATPGRYKIAVNSYSGGEGRRATLRVTINSGPSAGQSFDFGPYTFGGSNAEEDYPVTGNTAFWWRPADVIVNANGTITVVAPDTSIPLSRSRSVPAASKKK
jgi:uncharacterized protein YfaP (DUF2135 family)